MSNNRTIEGFWLAGSEGRVIAEKSGVVVAQCLWQEDAELIVSMRNGQRIAHLEGAISRLETAVRETGVPLPAGTASPAQLAEAIGKLSLKATQSETTAKSEIADAEVARVGWRDEINLRQQEIEAHAMTKKRTEALELQIRELERQLADRAGEVRRGRTR